MNNNKDLILIFGLDEVLLRTRSRVLEISGYAVLTAMQLSTYAATLQSEAIRLAVLCHSLSTADADAAIAMGRNHDPEVKTLVVSTGVAKKTSAAPSMTVNVHDGPVKLIQAVHGLIH